VHEVNALNQNNQLDMILLKPDPKDPSKTIQKIYICYHITKTLKQQNIQQDLIEPLFEVEESFTKKDTLFIITKDEMNDTLEANIKHYWESEKYFIVVVSLKRLQFNILNHSLVPPHRVLSDLEEITAIKNKYNITDNSQLPEISRFDPVAQAICLRPGEICEIKRPSKTAIETLYYRVCV
jgi:DNA-directed RNA polymerase subunit H (RpoH/RPB5)